MLACQGPAASLAVIDPVFAYLAPDSIKSFSATAQARSLLPDTEASASLYATIDAKAPKIVFLTPLLASEIEPILSRNDETRVIYLGNAHPRPNPRLYAAVFSSTDAAARAGDLAAAEAARLKAELPADDPPPSVAAVFAGTEELDARSEAFLEAYRAAGGSGVPIIEQSAQGFSQIVADRLKSLDIRIGYIAAAPRDAERWAHQAFDQYAYLAMEYSLPPQQTSSRADSFVAWDIEATLSSLRKNLSAGEARIDKGLWKIVLNDQTGGNRR